MKYGFNNVTVRSKDELNETISDEDIILHYFGDFEIDEYYISPRGENDPSLTFDYKNGELKWRDFGISVEPRNAVEYVMYLSKIKGFPINFMQALRKISSEVKGGSCKRSYDKLAQKSKNVALKFRKNFKDHEIKYWKDRGINKETLSKFHVYPCEVWFNKILWARSTSKDPVFVYLWNKARSIWKAYRPLAPEIIKKGRKQKVKFFANNIADHVQGWEYLPPQGHVVMVTKSYKDVMVLHELEIPAIAPHSESIFISQGMIANLKKRFNHVYVNYDNDSTGVKKSLEFTKQYDLKYWNVSKSYGIYCDDPASVSFNYGLEELKCSIYSKFERDGII